jgi:hypothetical protein
MGEGMLMPAFSFEKILPAAPGAAEAPTPTKIDEKTDKKPRGVIVQVLDRIAEARARRGQQKRSAGS